MSESADQTAERAGATLAGDLQAWEESFRIAIDTIPGLAWFGSAEGPVEFLNKQWCEYTGISMDAALGWGWTATIHPDDMSSLETQAMQGFDAGFYCAKVRQDARPRSGLDFIPISRERAQRPPPATDPSASAKTG